MKIVDIANELYLELGSPTSTSKSAIAYWLRSQIGRLNNLIHESFVVDSTSDEVTETIVTDPNNPTSTVTNEITPEAAAILKSMYKVYDLENQIRANMNLLITNGVLEVSDQHSSVKRVNRNEIAKTLASLKKDEIELMNNLIAAYQIDTAVVSQVAGDDTVAGIYPSLFPKYRRQ